MLNLTLGVVTVAASLAAWTTAVSPDLPLNSTTCTSPQAEREAFFGTIEGYVVFSDGGHAGGAVVYLQDANGNPIYGTEVTSDLNTGHFVMLDVPVGLYQVYSKVQMPYPQDGKATAEVAVNQTVSVTVVLSCGAGPW